MFKFGHIDMEKEENPILWDVHEVNGAAGNLLGGTDHFLFSFTDDFISKKYDIDGLNANYASEGGWEGHTRKFLVEQAIPRALKALA